MNEYCPYCGSGSIEYNRTFADEFDEEQHYEDTGHCHSCNNEWKKLTTISFVIEKEVVIVTEE